MSNMYILIMKGGDGTMNCCYGNSCGSEMRRFLTREEKVELLTEYKEHLDNESKGVAERISQLQKED